MSSLTRVRLARIGYTAARLLGILAGGVVGAQAYAAFTGSGRPVVLVVAASIAGASLAAHNLLWNWRWDAERRLRIERSAS